MTARVHFDATTAMGQLAAEAIASILDGKAKLARVVEAANAMIYVASGPADMTALEAEFGAAAGKGQQLFNDINGAKQALDDGRIVALRELDQG